MKNLYQYRLRQTADAAGYDEAVAAATLQGVFNRRAGDDAIYLCAERSPWPDFWLRRFTGDDGWLHAAERHALPDLPALVRLAAPFLDTVIIWDETVPATLNAATTIAGVENGIVLSAALAKTLLPLLPGCRCVDLRGRFTGAETGSAKNDVYRWAIREYVQTGRCSRHFLCLYEDSAYTRRCGNTGYAVTRDWAVYNRAFVYDLSPWGDELPGDDLTQPLGTDLQTYQLLLSAQQAQTAGQCLTEVAGFFSFDKYAKTPRHESTHGDVATEWETVYLISPYGCYQNTVAHNCFNQSVHSQFRLPALHQPHPQAGRTRHIENKCYLCIHMGDYDSSEPLYEKLPELWTDGSRGKLPLAWAVNPNLLNSCPDMIDWLYRTRTEQDFFVSDACGAGYFNPSRISAAQWPLLHAHNEAYFRKMGLSIAPMILDFEAPNRLTEQNYAAFAPDGCGVCVIDQHKTGAATPEPYLTQEGLLVDTLYIPASHCTSPLDTAQRIAPALENDRPGEPSFHYIRIVWQDAGWVLQALEHLRAMRPDLSIEVLNPYDYFAMHARLLRQMEQAPAALF